jgi:hypothetical protein
MGSGRVIKFLQPGDGVRLFSESAPAGSSPFLAKGMTAHSFAEVHRSLRPDEPTPAAVLEADRRVEAQKLAREAEPGQPVSEGDLPAVQVEDAPDTGLIEKHGTSSCSHFQDPGIGHGCYAGDFDDCLCNRKDGGSSNVGGSQYSYHAFASYRGTISFEILYRRQPVHTQVVAQGEAYWHTLESGSCSYCDGWGGCTVEWPCFTDHGHRVFNATDDGYHRHICVDWDGEIDRCDRAE